MSNDSGEVLELVLVEFTDGETTKLARVEKLAAFLERTCSDVRKEIQIKIPFHSLGKSIVTRTRVD